ncbi:Imm43 family immunity protein [Xenorhabdus bovienii]|uniref:Imm43 family immunity protein n=1 Tax=Xenorhabdus bovienii TaxID=40576 RepID=UPI0023B33977|nr:Imm43 family immunity protein [Xenorhabdus bovienii]
MIKISIKDGETIRDDLNYIYFTNNDDFLDFDKSKLEEDRYRGVIPHKLVFSEKVLSYDIFAITGTLLSGHIFLSEMVAEKFFEKKIAGLKLIKSEDAFKEYCLDYGYDIEINKKRAKRRLP